MFVAPKDNPQPAARCHSHPLNDAKLARYAELVAAQPVGPLKSILVTLLACVSEWWKLDESKQRPIALGTTLDGQTFNVVPLEPEHIASLDGVTPWLYELDAMQPIIMAMPDGKGPEIPARPGKPAHSEVVDAAALELKTAATDLLWHCKEISSDREPLTKDKLVRVS